MNIQLATLIKTLRLGTIEHSWRRIAEIICDRYPEYVLEQGWPDIDLAYGNQLLGQDLCNSAAEVLGIEELKE